MHDPPTQRKVYVKRRSPWDRTAEKSMETNQEPVEVKIGCPHCGQSLSYGEDMAGETIKCPTCEQAIALPAIAENDLFKVHPSAIAFLPRIALGVLLTPLIVGIFILLGVAYRIYSVTYRLTTERLFRLRGLIARQQEELELYRVKDVQAEQSVWQRLLKVGTIRVISSDCTMPTMELFGIREPLKVKEEIRTAYRSARKREGLRSNELIHSGAATGSTSP